jgi:hypothetical protein
MSPKVRNGLIVLVGLVWIFQEYQAGTLFNFQQDKRSTAVEEVASQTSQDDAVDQAFKRRQSDVIVQGQGNVKAVLPDDTKGSRHQKFILTLNSGLTVLVAHNIDLAPRLPNLQKGDTVSFQGEYEWNEKGGVIHWTHHDPAGRHPGGWLNYKDQRYE